jgi:hypothetical protein
VAGSGIGQPRGQVGVEIGMCRVQRAQYRGDQVGRCRMDPGVTLVIPPGPADLTAAMAAGPRNRTDRTQNQETAPHPTHPKRCLHDHHHPIKSTHSGLTDRIFRAVPHEPTEPGTPRREIHTSSHRGRGRRRHPPPRPFRPRTPSVGLRRLTASQAHPPDHENGESRVPLGRTLQEPVILLDFLPRSAPRRIAYTRRVMVGRP